MLYNVLYISGVLTLFFNDADSKIQVLYKYIHNEKKDPLLNAKQCS